MLLTIREAAARLGMSRRTVWRRLQASRDVVRQEIPGGVVVLIPEAVVDAMAPPAEVGRRVARQTPPATAARARRRRR